MLKDVVIDRPDHVWSTDITYIRIGKGFMYLTAVIDWFSRYVLSWRLSNTLENSFCIEVLEEALLLFTPEIFNTDQGSQYTSMKFLSILKAREIRISMDSKGRALDNVFVERLWRTIKYEEVYLKDYRTIREAHRSWKAFINFYNKERLHQALGYKTPASVYRTAWRGIISLWWHYNYSALTRGDWIYRIKDGCMGKGSIYARKLPSCFHHQLRRSGCFPTLPYPPSWRTKNTIGGNFFNKKRKTMPSVPLEEGGF